MQFKQKSCAGLRDQECKLHAGSLRSRSISLEWTAGLVLVVECPVAGLGGCQLKQALYLESGDD